MEMRQELLNKVDEVRKRKKVSYEVAKNALELNNFDTLDAVIYLENLKGERYEDLKDYKDKTVENIKKTGMEMMKFSNKDHEVELPIPVVAIGSLLLLKKPKLFVVLALGILLSGTDVTLNKGAKEFNLTKPIRKKTKKVFDDLSIDPKNLKRKVEKMTDKINFGHHGNEEDDFKGYFSRDLY